MMDTNGNSLIKTRNSVINTRNVMNIIHKDDCSPCTQNIVNSDSPHEAVDDVSLVYLPYGLEVECVFHVHYGQKTLEGV